MRKFAYLALTSLFISCAALPEEKTSAATEPNTTKITRVPEKNRMSNFSSRGIVQTLPYNIKGMNYQKELDIYNEYIVKKSYELPVYLLLHAKTRDSIETQQVEKLFFLTFPFDDAILYTANNLEHTMLHFKFRQEAFENKNLRNIELPILIFFKQGEPLGVIKLSDPKLAPFLDNTANCWFKPEYCAPSPKN